MLSLNIYLTFDGNCLEVFEFYKSVFGGNFESKSKFKEMPPDPNYPIADADKEKIMHITLAINKGTMLMGSDISGEWDKKIKQGNNFTISINADNKKHADNLFESLSKDGQVIMPMSNTFWGSYFGMLVDQFGIQWMVSQQQ